MKVTEHKKGLAAVALIASLAALYLTGVLPELPDPKKVIEDIARTLGGLTYVFVGALAFLETGAFVGLLVPGETTVIVGGVIAGQGEIDLLPLIGIVWVACVLGDTTSFLIGRRLGRGFILKHGSKVKIDEDRLEKVESYFERHGAVTIVAGRFVGLLRALTPFVAGSSAYPYRRFLPFSVIGCGAWVGLFSVLGFIFYRSFDQVAARRYSGSASRWRWASRPCSPTGACATQRNGGGWRGGSSARAGARRCARWRLCSARRCRPPCRI